MCRPQAVPSDWLFVSSWLDSKGLYTCATFVEPCSPYDSIDTQLMLEGFTIEELAGFDSIDTRELQYGDVVARYLKKNRVKLLHGGKRKN